MSWSIQRIGLLLPVLTGSFPPSLGNASLRRRKFRSQVRFFPLLLLFLNTAKKVSFLFFFLGVEMGSIMPFFGGRGGGSSLLIFGSGICGFFWVLVLLNRFWNCLRWLIVHFINVLLLSKLEQFLLQFWHIIFFIFWCMIYLKWITTPNKRVTLLC